MPKWKVDQHCGKDKEPLSSILLVHFVCLSTWGWTHSSRVHSHGLVGIEDFLVQPILCQIGLAPVWLRWSNSADSFQHFRCVSCWKGLFFLEDTDMTSWNVRTDFAVSCGQKSARKKVLFLLSELNRLNLSPHLGHFFFRRLYFALSFCSNPKTWLMGKWRKVWNQLFPHWTRIWIQTGSRTKANCFSLCDWFRDVCMGFPFPENI